MSKDTKEIIEKLNKGNSSTIAANTPNLSDSVVLDDPTLLKSILSTDNSKKAEVKPEHLQKALSRPEWLPAAKVLVEQGGASLKPDFINNYSPLHNCIKSIRIFGDLTRFYKEENNDYKSLDEEIRQNPYFQFAEYLYKIGAFSKDVRSGMFIRGVLITPLTYIHLNSNYACNERLVELLGKYEAKELGIDEKTYIEAVKVILNQGWSSNPVTEARRTGITYEEIVLEDPRKINFAVFKGAWQKLNCKDLLKCNPNDAENIDSGSAAVNSRIDALAIDLKKIREDLEKRGKSEQAAAVNSRLDAMAIDLKKVMEDLEKKRKEKQSASSASAKDYLFPEIIGIRGTMESLKESETMALTATAAQSAEKSASTLKLPGNK